MFDGRILNNFPVHQMRKMGAGQIIGVDLMFDKKRVHALSKTPSSWAIIRDRLRPKHKRKYKLPSLPATMLSSMVVTSMAKQKAYRGAVDILFQPNVRGVGMLEWKKYDQVVTQSYEAAKAQLDAMEPAALETFKA